MEAFVISTGVVALGEMGDKTQLLAMVLAATYRRPLPIVWGILLATLLNHAVAGLLGGWMAQALGPEALRWVVGVSFLAMSIWLLIPDRLEDESLKDGHRWGIFLTTLVAFFLAEMGDKTQLATVALAARFVDVIQVVLGTTLGMMIANVPVVFLGNKLLVKVPMRLVHAIAAATFAVLGLVALTNWGGLLEWAIGA